MRYIEKVDKKEQTRIKRELETKAREGDVEALMRLLEIYRPRLESMAYRWCKDFQIAQDLVSEAYLRVWRFWKDFEGGSLVWTWVYRITINVCKNYIKCKKESLVKNAYEYNDESLKYNVTGQYSSDPSEDVEAIMSGEKIEKAYDKLPYIHKEILELFEKEGLLYREIADKLGISIGTVRSRLFNAREALAKVVEDFER